MFIYQHLIQKQTHNRSKVSLAVLTHAVSHDLTAALAVNTECVCFTMCTVITHNVNQSFLKYLLRFQTKLQFAMLFFEHIKFSALWKHSSLITGRKKKDFMNSLNVAYKYKISVSWGYIVLEY